MHVWEELPVLNASIYLQSLGLTFILAAVNIAEIKVVAYTDLNAIKLRMDFSQVLVLCLLPVLVNSHLFPDQSSLSQCDTEECCKLQH